MYFIINIRGTIIIIKDQMSLESSTTQNRMGEEHGDNTKDNLTLNSHLKAPKRYSQSDNNKM